MGVKYSAKLGRQNNENKEAGTFLKNTQFSKVRQEAISERCHILSAEKLQLRRHQISLRTVIPFLGKCRNVCAVD